MEEKWKAIFEKAKKSKWLIISVAGFIVLLVTLRIIFNPAIQYSRGEKLFDAGKFSSSAEHFLKAGDYKDASSKAKIATNAQNYVDGEAYFEAEKYTEAVACFKNAGNYEDATARVITAQYGVHYQNAEDAFSREDYATAVSEFKEARTFKDAKKRAIESTYALADADEKREKYEKAIEGFDSVSSYSDAKERIFAIGLSLLKLKDYTLAETAFEKVDTSESEAYYNYALGKEAFEQSRYDDAKYYFAKCTVEDAEDLRTACDYLIAEERYRNGELNKAKTRFESLPKDYSYNNGVTVGERLEQLEKFKSFVALCGTWKPTDNYIESRNIYRRNGSWDNWYIDSVVSNQSITVRCVINEDSTVTLKGEVSFYCFTDYSSLKEYCNATQTTRTFTIKNVTQVPASYVIDSNTTLKFANNVFSISYYVKDEYSAYFYNTYTSRVTFGRLDTSL